MSNIFSKTFVRKQDADEIQLELQLADTPYGTESEEDMDAILYSPKEDEEILQLITPIEFEHTMEWGGPSDVLHGKEDVIYATSLKYRHPKEHEIPEMATYTQGKEKVVDWGILLQGVKAEVKCTFEYFVFHRNPYGDIRKLHPYEHDMSLRIPKDKEIILTFQIVRADHGMLECGRYYVVFRLRGQDGLFIDNPIIQYINVVPAKTKVVHVESKMVGMEAVYRQMASLVKQKMFNDQRQALNMEPAPINLHAAVMGDKGAGKTAFARVLYDYYVQNGFITEGILDIVDAARWSRIWDDPSALEHHFTRASKGMLYIENAASLIGAADMRGNKLVGVETLVNQLRDPKNDLYVVVADTPERISQLLNSADLGSYIGQIYKLPTLTLDQMMEIGERDCLARGFLLTKEAKTAMKSYLSSQLNATTADVSKLIDAMIMNMSVRVVTGTKELFLTSKLLTELQAEDVPQPRVGGYTQSMSKLNALVGLKNLKYNIESHLNLVRFAQLRRQNGLQAIMPPLHMIFTGNPGTGKTTVASLLGEIYASLGILSTGQVITADRKKLVGQYIGDTEENTKRYLQRAHGNILFIDEAYTLVADPDDKKDFGPKVLDCLLEELSKESTDMIIILAGYPDEMEKMLRSNKGLQSRFPYTFHFEDYTEEELMEIAVRTAESSGYVFSEEAMSKLRQLVHREMERTAKHDEKNFGNARFVTRLISTQIIPSMSRRVLSPEAGSVSPQMLSRIEVTDIPNTADNTDYTIDEALIARTLKQLDELKGQEHVKQTLHNLVALARTRYQHGEDLLETIPLQWTFTGSTGTGKSSIARLLAQILHAFHLISSDRMTQVRMPETHNGAWTAYDIDRILRDTMKQSGLGLLFIDLDDVANSHIDVRWLRCKLTSLTAEMPGSHAFVIAVDDSRMPAQPIDMPLSTSVLQFADYTADELMAILNDRLSKQSYTLSDEASQMVYAHIQALCANRGAGLANARTIKHLYIALTSAAELRRASANTPNMLMEITMDDVEAIRWKQINSGKIGFESAQYD